MINYIALLKFIPQFTWMLVATSLAMSLDIIRGISQEGIIAYHLDLVDERAIFALAQLITLTPGTMTLDWKPEEKIFLIHAMRAHHPEAVIHSIKTGLEAPLKEIFNE